MLLRFRVKNHLSLKEEQEISLLASALKDRPDGLIAANSLNEEQVLPAIVIYGANASGKSNVLSALRFLRDAVVKSHLRGTAGNEGIARQPFAFDPETTQSPSEFSVDFIAKDIRYSYGFTCSDDEFIQEWLYQFPSGRSQMLFERKNSKFKFGRSLKGRNKLISDLVRPDALFISVAWQNSHEQLSIISEYFSSIYGDLSVRAPSTGFNERTVVDARTIAFLQKVGSGVVDYRKVEYDVPDEMKQFTSELAKLVEVHVGTAIDPTKKPMTIELGHLGSGGTPVYLPLERESAGTRRLLRVLSRMFRALDAGAPIVIDEFDASLHTLACESILRLFQSKKTNPLGAQLITTTHDTNILRSPYLRRDQIWFAEKNRLGESHIYPLTDIHTRSGDNLEKGYLQGRFGAIPFAGDPLPASDEWLEDISKASNGEQPSGNPRDDF